jgi:signal transduction histidine kinase
MLFTLTIGFPLAWSLANGIADLSAPLLGVLLLRRVFRFDQALQRTSDAFALVIAGGVIPNLVAAALGIGTLYAAGNLPAHRVPGVFAIWALADIAAVIVVTPLLLSLFGEKRSVPIAVSRSERVLVSTMFIVACLWAFGTYPQVFHGAALPVYVVFPFIVCAALRYGERTTNVMVFVGSLFAIWSCVRFFDVSDETRALQVVNLQVFMALMGTAGLLLCATDTQRRKSAQAVHEANEGLERKVADRTQELRAANVRLQEADRVKTQFLASMSHELRTPLNAIIGFTGTLLMKLPGPLTEEQEAQLGIVRENARHLLSLINDLLDLDRIEAGRMELRPEPVQCQKLVEEVAATLRPLADKKKLAFGVDMSEAPIEVIADPRALRQIVLNLAANAINYTERGGVRLSLHLLSRQEGDYVEFAVTDSGVGIKPEDRQRLFRAFSQLSDGTHNGSGLGLHLSQKFARLLGGEIEMESEYGKGSRFALLLPVPRSVDSRPSPQSQGADPDGTPRDDPRGRSADRNSGRRNMMPTDC